MFLKSSSHFKLKKNEIFFFFCSQPSEELCGVNLENGCRRRSGGVKTTSMFGMLMLLFFKLETLQQFSISVCFPRENQHKYWWGCIKGKVLRETRRPVPRVVKTTLGNSGRFPLLSSREHSFFLFIFHCRFNFSSFPR